MPPIRRYRDLVVHRLLRAVLAGHTTPAGTEFERGSRGMFAIRALPPMPSASWWSGRNFMAERIGQDFDALIVSTAKYGLFVEPTDLFYRRAGAARYAARGGGYLSRERAQGQASGRAARSRSATASASSWNG